MKNLLWLVFGVVAGVIAVRVLDARGSGPMPAGVREFGRTVADSYRAREAELRSAIRGDVDRA